MLKRKSLDDYKKLFYKIIIEAITDKSGTDYMAYTHELGKYSCYGTGKTEGEAIASFKDEKDDFLEYLYDAKKPIPEPVVEQEEPLPNGVITLRTTPVLHAQLVNQAKQNNVSLNQYLNQILSSTSAVNDVKNHIDKRLQYVCDRMAANFDAFYGWMRDRIMIEKEKIATSVRKYKTDETDQFFRDQGRGL